jgi:ATP phosphoribosyltransferase regulatory subunit
VLTVDLADLRGYRYHNGVMFSIYCSGLPNAVVRGGRYDGIGQSFGRARPATGFSMELREILAIAQDSNSAPVAAQSAVAAPWLDDQSLRAAIAKLRQAGTAVVQLPADEFQAWPGKKINKAGDLWRVA